MDYHFQNQESSSGCESGWTLYLDHSSIFQSNDEHDYLTRKTINRSFSKNRTEEGETEEDEDLSMVSDASSGPPHFHDEENKGYLNVPLSRNRPKTKENRRSKVKDQSSLLDDTASSPMFDYSNNNYNSLQPKRESNLMEEYSQGYSTTQFDVRPPYQEHYDFFPSPVISGNQFQQNQWFDEGKRW